MSEVSNLGFWFNDSCSGTSSNEVDSKRQMERSRKGKHLGASSDDEGSYQALSVVFQDPSKFECWFFYTLYIGLYELGIQHYLRMLVMQYIPQCDPFCDSYLIILEHKYWLIYKIRFSEVLNFLVIHTLHGLGDLFNILKSYYMLQLLCIIESKKNMTPI